MAKFALGMLKKLAAIGLFGAMLLPFWGAFSLLKFEQCVHRKSVKRAFLNALPPVSLTRIAVLSTDKDVVLKWEHSREFEWNRDMYDIVNQNIEGDSTIYHCWKDHQDTALNNRLEGVIKLAWQGRDQNQENPPELEFLKRVFRSPPFAIAENTSDVFAAYGAFKASHYRCINPGVSPRPPAFLFA